MGTTSKPSLLCAVYGVVLLLVVLAPEECGAIQMRPVQLSPDAARLLNTAQRAARWAKRVVLRSHPAIAHDDTTTTPTVAATVSGDFGLEEVQECDCVCSPPHLHAMSDSSSRTEEHPPAAATPADAAAAAAHAVVPPHLRDVVRHSAQGGSTPVPAETSAVTGGGGGGGGRTDGGSATMRDAVDCAKRCASRAAECAHLVGEKATECLRRGEHAVGEATLRVQHALHLPHHRRAGCEHASTSPSEMAERLAKEAKAKASSAADAAKEIAGEAMETITHGASKVAERAEAAAKGAIHGASETFRAAEAKVMPDKHHHTKPTLPHGQHREEVGLRAEQALRDGPDRHAVVGGEAAEGQPATSTSSSGEQAREEAHSERNNATEPPRVLLLPLPQRVPLLLELSLLVPPLVGLWLLWRLVGSLWRGWLRPAADKLAHISDETEQPAQAYHSAVQQVRAAAGAASAATVHKTADNVGRSPLSPLGSPVAAASHAEPEEAPSPTEKVAVRRLLEKLDHLPDEVSNRVMAMSAVASASNHLARRGSPSVMQLPVKPLSAASSASSSTSSLGGDRPLMVTTLVSAPRRPTTPSIATDPALNDWVVTHEAAERKSINLEEVVERNAHQLKAFRRRK